MTKLNFVKSLLTEIKLQYAMPGPLAMCLASKHNPQYYGAKNWYRAISWFKLLVKKRVVIRGTPWKKTWDFCDDFCHEGPQQSVKYTSPRSK